MINKTNISKSQHYVPKFYLKNFSQENNKIHIFSKTDNKKFCANISKIANENYFYKIPDIPQESKKSEKLELTEEQKKQEIEKLLGSLDSKSNRALLKFLQHIKSCKLKPFPLENNHKSISLDFLEIDKDLRYNLSTFFVLQDLRTKEHRESIRQLYDGTLTEISRRMIEYDNSDEIKKNNDELKKLGIDPKDLLRSS